MKNLEDAAMVTLASYNSPYALGETDIFLAATHYAIYGYYWLIDIAPILLKYQLKQMGRDATQLIQEILGL